MCVYMYAYIYTIKCVDRRRESHHTTSTISSYYYIMLFTMKGYTSFRYENNLATQLYTTQAKSKPKANEDDDSGIQTPTQKD